MSDMLMSGPGQTSSSALPPPEPTQSQSESYNKEEEDGDEEDEVMRIKERVTRVNKLISKELVAP